MSIVTKTGDKGTTALFGGVRVSKNHIRIECNGQIDELNVRIGNLRVLLDEKHEWQDELHRIQLDLMLLMSHIATLPEANKPNTKKHPKDGILKCEKWIETLKKSLSDEIKFFTLPGGTEIAVACHFIRTGTRTVERLLVAAHKEEPLPEYVLQYFNRLSDLFYVLALSELKNNKIRADRFMKFSTQK